MKEDRSGKPREENLTRGGESGSFTLLRRAGVFSYNEPRSIQSNEKNIEKKDQITLNYGRKKKNGSKEKEEENEQLGIKRGEGAHATTNGRRPHLEKVERKRKALQRREHFETRNRGKKS